MPIAGTFNESYLVGVWKMTHYAEFCFSDKNSKDFNWEEVKYSYLPFQKNIYYFKENGILYKYDNMADDPIKLAYRLEDEMLIIDIMDGGEPIKSRMVKLTDTELVIEDSHDDLSVVARQWFKRTTLPKENVSATAF
ncbi:MAG: lipocalin family protein [Tannerellaceae bacterium]|jgi:hypothetical protein|nr:lipocalin family protein [Tannerellaceae bacterium]